jgi:hypothetical protein
MNDRFPHGRQLLGEREAEQEAGRGLADTTFARPEHDDTPTARRRGEHGVLVRRVPLLDPLGYGRLPGALLACAGQDLMVIDP